VRGRLPIGPTNCERFRRSRVSPTEENSGLSLAVVTAAGRHFRELMRTIGKFQFDSRPDDGRSPIRSTQLNVKSATAFARIVLPRLSGPVVSRQQKIGRAIPIKIHDR
jgi:hypothetical protein